MTAGLTAPSSPQTAGQAAKRAGVLAWAGVALVLGGLAAAALLAPQTTMAALRSPPQHLPGPRGPHRHVAAPPPTLEQRRRARFECAHAHVPPPPPLSEAKAAAGADAVAQIRALGTLGAYESNTTLKVGATPCAPKPSAPFAPPHPWRHARPHALGAMRPLAGCILAPCDLLWHSGCMLTTRPRAIPYPSLSAARPNPPLPRARPSLMG